MVRASLPAALIVAGVVAAQAAQTPTPFPRPGEQRPTASAPAAPRPVPAQTAPAPSTGPAGQTAGAPDEQTLGVPVFAGAEFITSYDAGRNQRYYLFGTNAPFAEVVAYYRTALRQRGELVYDEPPIHQFDVGRFREETMAFPPGVTVKDYASGTALGYMNPKRGAQPARFRTILQIVPVARQ